MTSLVFLGDKEPDKILVAELIVLQVLGHSTREDSLDDSHTDSCNMDRYRSYKSLVHRHNTDDIKAPNPEPVVDC